MSKVFLARPQNLEAEQALIAACLINPKIIPKVQAVLAPSDFHRTAHEHVFQLLCELKENSTLPAIQQCLTDRGLLEKIGGIAYLVSLSEAVSTSAGWEQHTEITKTLATRRRLIDLCSSISDGAFQGLRAPEDLLADLRTGVRKVQAEQMVGYRSSKDLVNQVWKDIEERQRSKNPFVGVKTGLSDLDFYTLGLEPKTTIYIAARPSMGKTALALQIASHVAASAPGRVLYFTLESTDVAITRRMLAARSGIALTRIRSGEVRNDQWKDLTKASSKLQAGCPVILDNPKLKIVEHLMSTAESLAMDGPLSLIVVDHIQRMKTKRREQSRHHELSSVSEELGTLAKELNVPVMVLCQLSREIEKRTGKGRYPRESDLKESGDLEQNADMVLGLWRAGKESPSARLEGLKGRDVGTFTIWLHFDPSTQRFKDGTEPEEETAQSGSDL